MLSGKHIKLVPYSERYFDFVYSAESDLDEKYLWSDQRNVPLRSDFGREFHDRLEHEYFNYFVITSLEDVPLGFIYTYQYHPWDHNLYMTIYITKNSRKGYASTEAPLLLIDYLFKYYRLNKIYTIVYDYNKDSLNYQLNASFEEEGLMKNHRFYNGRYHDAHLLALYPDKFYERFDQLLARLTSGTEENDSI